MIDKNSVYFRYIICGFILLIAGIINFNPSFIIKIHGSYPNLLLILLIVFAAFEHAVAGAFFGLFAGVLHDLSVTNGNGIHAVLYMLTGFIIGFLYQFLLQNNILSLIITALSVLVLTSVIDWSIKTAYYGGNIYSASFHQYFYSAVYSFVLLILVYYIFKITLKKKRTSYFIRANKEKA